MSKDLLSELHAAGELASRGGFSIDSEKAREKLRQYQLADPHRYVLLLVEAASMAGARKLEFEIDSDDVHLRLAEVGIERRWLENIYGSLFIELDEQITAEERQILRGLQQLALALNSAMALNPRFIRVLSAGPDGKGSRLELRPDAADELEEVQGQPPGTWIHVRDRFRPGLLVEFFRTIRGKVAEMVLLREHCRWSRIPVMVNQELISSPMSFEREHWTAIDVVDQGLTIGRAALGLAREDAEDRFAEPTVSLLCHGVAIEEAGLRRGVPGFAAIVDSPRLRKDVSQSSLIHDDEYKAVIGAVIAAQDRLITRLAERRVARTAPVWADMILRKWLASQPVRDARAQLEGSDAFAAVAEVPLWRTVGAGPISTRTLIEHERSLRRSSEDFEFAPVDLPFVVLCTEPDELALLEQLFGDVIDYTSALRREHERQRHRLAFMNRGHLPELGEGPYVVREVIHTEVRTDKGKHSSVHGELGVRAIGQRDSWIRLVKEGCLLTEQQLEGPLPGLCVVVQAEFAPNETYEWAKPDELLARVLVVVLETLERAMRGLAASGVVSAAHVELRELLRLYLHQVCSGDYADELLTQFGFSRRQARRRLARIDHRAIRPAWSFDEGERLHPLARVPLFERARGSTPRSLDQLRAQVEAGERIAWLEAGTGPLPLIEREVLMLDRGDREVLRELLGKEALTPFGERLEWLRRREAFLERPVATPQLPHAPLAPDAKVPLEGLSSAAAPELTGELALREFMMAGVADGTTPVTVHYRGRFLCEVELELPLPGLCAWVDSNQLEPTGNFDGLADTTPLRRVLIAGLAKLVGAELRRAREDPARLRRCEWWFLAMVPAVALGDGGVSRAFVELVAAHGIERALEDLDRTLALLERYPRRDLERAIGRLRGHGRLPEAEALDQHLRRPTRRVRQAEVDLAVLRRSLVPVLGELFELAMIRRFEGPQVRADTPRTVCLGELLASVVEGTPIAWVVEGYELEPMPRLEGLIEGAIVSVDGIEQRLLAKIFGEEALERISEWLEGRARFERRKRIDEIRVPRGSTLVTLEVERPEVRGQIGISREPPREVRRSRIRVFTEGREVALVDIPADPVALVGALEFDELELSASHEDISSSERDRVRGLARLFTEELLDELAARFGELERDERHRAAELVRHLLVNWPPGVGGFQARASKRPKKFRRLAGLPAFPGARKPWSAIELAEGLDHGGVATIDTREGGLSLPECPVVVLERPDIEGVLRALFGDLRDLQRELEHQRQLAARKANAPIMRGVPPAGALAVIEVAGEGLEGWLWLVPDQAQVLFGEDGRAAEARVISDLCWCGGEITGAGLSIAKNWSRVILTGSQDRLLERHAIELWIRLIDEFEGLAGDRAPREREDRRRFVEVRKLLRSLFLRLHARHGGEKTHKRRASRKQDRNRGRRGNRYERLYERMRELPLLELGSGRWISAEVAERERPIELASLELWFGPSAEEIAHQRAIERKEAERRRREELERRRERERERRRSRAEAHKAERRRNSERKRQAGRRVEPKSKSKSKSKVRAPEQTTPEEALLEALRDELRLVRSGRRGLLSNRLLESLELGQPERRGSLFRHAEGKVSIDSGHALFEAVLDTYLEDPAALTLLASAAYTYLNLIHSEIEDSDEADFLRLHAAHAATCVRE